jgi:hypothetical protein
MIVAALGIVVLLALCFLLARSAARETIIRCPQRLRRRPRELRGDWWSKFELELREYERRQALQARRRRDSQDQRPPPR